MFDFSKFMIVTDLDSTFLADGKLVPRNLEALRRFRDGGGIFTIATGRAHLNTRSAIGDPCQLLNAPAICDNGAYLYDFFKKESLYQDLIRAKDARDLIAFAKTSFPDVRFSVSAVSSIRSEENAGCVARDMPTYEREAVCIAPADTWPLDDWYKFLFLDDTPRLQEVREGLLSHFGDRFVPTCSSTWILEVQYPGIHKAKGLQKLKKHLNGAKKRTIIACGDFENDVEMLEEADVAVCPANALPQVKKVADHVLCDCHEGLIADVIEAIEQGRIQPRH
ncbi:MAG: HAD family hydrolase [Ruminococcaceae bacterium]|nr:HAD family hydrolase [Oscillospiraceae bacterium]